MTAIVGLVENGRVWIGADSASVESDRLVCYPVKCEKVFIKGQFIYGFSQSFRSGQVLRYSFIPPKHPKQMDTTEYLSTLFVDRLRKTYEKAGYGGKDEEGELGGHFVLGYNGKLFTMQDDYNVSESVDNYTAVGCADLACFGSLYSTEGKFPEERIRMALDAAKHFSGGVKEPFIIKSIKGE